MQVGRFLLMSILTPDDAAERLRRFKEAELAGVTGDSFNDAEEVAAFQFIHDYVRRYKTVPTIEITQVESGVRFPDFLPDEPFEFWLNEVLRLKVVGVLYHGALDILKFLQENKDGKAREIARTLSRAVDNASDNRGVQLLSDLLDAEIERHDLRQRYLIKPGIPTGFPYIDKVTDGAQPGDSWAIAGSSGVGKTYIMCRSALEAASKGNKVLFVSMEMPASQITRRTAALGAGVSGTGFRLGRLSWFAMQKVRDFVSAWKEGRDKESFILVEGRIRLSVDDVYSIVDKYHPDVVYIDGAYMVQPSLPLKQTWERVKATFEELKQMAMNENVPVISSVQFAKKGAKDGIEGIGYSYAISQLASVVLAIYNPDDDDEHADYDNVYYKVLELIKGREGEQGKVLLKYDMKRSLIEESAVLEEAIDAMPD